MTEQEPGLELLDKICNDAHSAAVGAIEGAVEIKSVDGAFLSGLLYAAAMLLSQAKRFIKDRMKLVDKAKED